MSGEAPLLPPRSRERGTTMLPAGVRRDRIEPLWDRIDRERLKVAAFLVVFVVSVGVSAGAIIGAAMMVAGFLLVYDPTSRPVFFGAVPFVAVASVIVGAAAATAHVVRSLTHPEVRLLTQFGARWVDQGERLGTKSALHDMALAAGLAHAPQLWVIEGCTRINACVLGVRERNLAVAVTEGFIARLAPDDQRAVFANLMARVRLGDAVWATVVSAVAGPIWHSRERDLRRDDEADEGPANVRDARELVSGVSGMATAGAGYLPVFLFASLAVILTEVLMAGHQRAAMVAAEKGDAEGMLLLKDPRAMLRGLEKVLEANNTVPGAGEAYSMLFYCWAGFGFAPEDDPEMERVARLREVLGPEGMA